MKWINAEQQVTVTIYDEENEEPRDIIMTVEEMLDTYTNEGCPAIYSNPESAGYCRDCKWSKYHINVDKYGNAETYWRCRNWDGGTDEEGYCHEWEARMEEE